MGFKQLVTNHIYVGAEAYRIAYQAMSSSQSVGLLSLFGPGATSPSTLNPGFTYFGLNVGYTF